MLEALAILAGAVVFAVVVHVIVDNKAERLADEARREKFQWEMEAREAQRAERKRQHEAEMVKWHG